MKVFAKFLRRTVSILLTVCMLVGGGGWLGLGLGLGIGGGLAVGAGIGLGAMPPQAAQAAAAPAAATVFKPEKIIQFEDGAYDSAINKYSIMTAAPASGLTPFYGQYLYVTSGSNGAPPTTGNNDVPWDQPEAAVSFSFDIPKEGLYYIWFRYKNSEPGNTGTRSWWLKWDGDPGAQTGWNYAGWGIEMTDFEWTQSKDGYGGQYGNIDSVNLTAGLHTLYFMHRQKSMSMDALYLTASQDARPPDSINFQIEKPALFIEAEICSLYEIQEDANALEGSFMYVPYTAGTGDLADPWDYAPGPGAVFTFDIPTSGDYYLWFRYRPLLSNPTGTRSWWIKWDGDPTVEAGWDRGGWDSTLTDFDWSRASDYNGQYGNLDKVTLTAGVHTLYWTHRQRGLSMDAVYLATSQDAVPGEDTGGGGDGELSRQPLSGTTYPAPTILPVVGEHPRLLFRAGDIPALKANYDKSQNAAAKRAFETLAASNYDGRPTGSNPSQNYNGQDLGRIEAMALNYALFGDAQSGQRAVDAIKTYLPLVTFPTGGDPYRPMGQVIFTASEVYDWCHDLLSEEDKLHLVYYSEQIARNANGNGMEIGYPPRGQGAICGHGSEAQLLRDLLSFGVATFDEYPDIYNYIGGRFFNDYIAPRNFWYDSNTQHQGSSYGGYRFTWDMWSAWIIKRMSGIDAYSAQMQYVPYEWIYTRRPDGQIFRAGDDYIEGQQTGYFRLSPAFLLAANYYGDEYMKYEALRQNPNFTSFGYTNDSLTPVHVLLFNDPDLGTSNFNSLPYSKLFAQPAGYMAARTGWTEGARSDVAIGLMKITEYWGANHHHLEAGSFQLYYKGILASDSGFYDSYGSAHDYNYNKRSIAHNTLTIFNPSESFDSRANDGGQRLPAGAGEPATMVRWMQNDDYRTGEVLGQELGPDLNYPEYTYIKGDITRAYSGKVSEVLRSMVFLPLDDPDHPAAMIVMDKVTSTNPSYKKSYLLHMQQAPSVVGNKSTILNTAGSNNGKMVNETLLPKNAVITQIGGPGNEFVVNGVNYPYSGSKSASMEPGWGRIEISPDGANATDYFLNVMTVSDADGVAPDLDSTLLEGAGWVGAVVADRAAIFAEGAARLENEVRFTIPAGSGNGGGGSGGSGGSGGGSGGFYKVFISGIKEGTWLVNGGGNSAIEVVSTVEGGAVYFEAESGEEVVLSYLNGNAIRPPVEPLPPDESRSGNILRVGNNTIYCDVDPISTDPNPSSDGHGFMVQGTVVFEALATSNIAYDSTTETLTGITKEGVEVTVWAGSVVAGFGTGILPLATAPRVVNGVLMIPVELLETAFYSSSTWDALTFTLTLQPGNKPQAAAATANIIDCDYSGWFEDQVGENSYDGDTDYTNGTLWSVDGAGGAWIWYEFDEVYTVKSALIYFNNYNARTTDFTLSYSMDGVNWVKIDDFQSDGATYGQTIVFPAPIVAKYIRYDFIRNNGTTSTFCAIRNIAFLIVAPVVENVTVVSGAVLPGAGGEAIVEITGDNLEGQAIAIYIGGADSGAAVTFGAGGEAQATVTIPPNTSDELIFLTLEVWLNGAPTGELAYVAVEAAAPIPVPAIIITGPDTVAPGGGEGTTATYTISAKDMAPIQAIDLEIRVDGSFLSSKEFTPGSGFMFLSAGSYGTPLHWTNAGDIWTGKAILYYAGGTGGSGGSGLAGASGDFDILSITFNAAEGKLGPTDVQVTSVALSYAGAAVDRVIAIDTVTTVFEQWYSPFDLNKDGVIDLNDLTYALQFLTMTPADPEWEQAKACDYDDNKIIEIADLILILANYTIPYYT